VLYPDIEENPAARRDRNAILTAVEAGSRAAALGAGCRAAEAEGGVLKENRAPARVLSEAFTGCQGGLGPDWPTGTGSSVKSIKIRGI